ncbi:laccase 14 [Prunus dulcis]|uniref:laccase n=1 Tax=Prunus dulcis TaxID=3755 RepID=A0A4Y1QW19_PRUDU|nr:laccase 14 [Prunus dulcis]
MFVKSSSYTRLCSTKDILTVNGQFPGPSLKAHRGDKMIIKCPIRPGTSTLTKLSLQQKKEQCGGMHTVDGQEQQFMVPFWSIQSLVNGGRKIMEIPRNANITGGEPILSDAYTINGKPGHLYPCSKSGIFEMTVEHGKTYLLRIISAVMDEELFFGIANHKMILVGRDGSYTKQIETSYIMIAPGQSMDVLLQANQPPASISWLQEHIQVPLELVLTKP